MRTNRNLNPPSASSTSMSAQPSPYLPMQTLPFTNTVFNSSSYQTSMPSIRHSSLSNTTPSLLDPSRVSHVYRSVSSYSPISSLSTHVHNLTQPMALQNSTRRLHDNDSNIGWFNTLIELCSDVHQEFNINNYAPHLASSPQNFSPLPIKTASPSHAISSLSSSQGQNRPILGDHVPQHTIKRKHSSHKSGLTKQPSYYATTPNLHNHRVLSCFLKELPNLKKLPKSHIHDIPPVPQEVMKIRSSIEAGRFLFTKNFGATLKKLVDKHAYIDAWKDQSHDLGRLLNTIKTMPVRT